MGSSKREQQLARNTEVCGLGDAEDKQQQVRNTEVCVLEVVKDQIRMAFGERGGMSKRFYDLITRGRGRLFRYSREHRGVF